MLPSTLNGKTLTIFLDGRIDSGRAPEVQSQIKEIIDNNDFDELLFDFNSVKYISSAGLRIILMTQKRMNGESKKMSVINPNASILSVFQMTGFSEIINIRQKIKHIDLKGAEKIAQGLCAEVYRIDGETVLKLYNKGLDQEMMYKEKDYAKEAFVLGIPTAISYDMVESDGRIGILFEMIKAKDLASTMRDDIKNLPKYAKMFSDLAKTVHESDGSKTDLPRKRDGYVKLLAEADFLCPAEKAIMNRMLDEIPVGTSVVHGDFHPANTMISNGELVFIDMGDLGVSEPYSDLAQVYSIYHYDEPHSVVSAISKISDADRHRFYDLFIDDYFNHPTKEELAEQEKIIRRYLAFRVLFFIKNFESTREFNIGFLKELIAENA